MNTFEEAGKAMLLGDEGRQQIYREIHRSAGRFGGRLKSWLVSVFAKAPSTEVPRT